jgi:hypothetical protein
MTQMTNVVTRRSRDDSPHGKNMGKQEGECCSCKHENADMQCRHPLEGTKEFLAMEQSDCWEWNGRKSIARNNPNKE